MSVETEVLFEGGLLVLGVYFTSNTVAHGFDPWSGQAKGYKIGIYCFSIKAHSIEERICDMEFNHVHMKTTNIRFYGARVTESLRSKV